MEHDEQAPNDLSDSNDSTEPSPPIAGSGSTRLVVMGVVLTVMIVMALIQSGARNKRDAAADAAGKLMESDDYSMPADYMKAVGKTARIQFTDETLTQVYRWNGVLQHFELRVVFIGSKGDYSIQDVKSSAVSRFKAKDISKLALAKQTGTELEEFPELQEGETIEGGAPGGRSGGGSSGGPRGGSGGGGGGGPRGGGMTAESLKTRLAASFQTLNLDEDQQAKVDTLIEDQVKESMVLISNPGEGMREKFGALRVKYTALYKEVLTEEQFEAYEKAREAGRKQRGGGGGGGPPPPPGAGGPPPPGGR
ncbi:MAG: hypothetical protein H8E27_03400 [Verrucomicrobia subdivision 3 bacterium]|nr:hypothetical protein [Limisphaerales bacterium]